MHAKNFATPRPQFAAQAEIENKTKGKTQKACQKIGKKGLNQLVRVGMLQFCLYVAYVLCALMALKFI